MRSGFPLETRVESVAQPSPSNRTKAVDMQAIPGRVLDDTFWEDLWGSSDLDMREKIIALTFEAISRVGPSTFNVKLVCEELEVSYSLINHHFGSRDELIAETAFYAYTRYVDELWESAKKGKNPKQRLKNWLLASVSWSTRASGWGVILNYPTASLDISNIITEKYKQPMADWGQLNLARLLQLIIDVKKNRISDNEYQLGNLPLTQLLANTKNLYLMSSIGWSILGLAVWSAGRHLPTGQTKESRLHERMAVKNHINRIINQIDGEQMEID